MKIFKWRIISESSFNIYKNHAKKWYRLIDVAGALASIEELQPLWDFLNGKITDKDEVRVRIKGMIQVRRVMDKPKRTPFIPKLIKNEEQFTHPFTPNKGDE